MAPGTETIERTLQQAEHCKDVKGGADALLIYSCMGRLLSFGPEVENETMAITGLWNVPSAGFFTYGEFGPDPNGHYDFHNYTLSLALLKEK